MDLIEEHSDAKLNPAIYFPVACKTAIRSPAGGEICPGSFLLWRV
jgi:hypothetical protein